MSEISAKDVMALRERTGVSMMACKQALTEANGDEEKAIEILRKSGIAKAEKKADRSTSEGAVKIFNRAIVKLNCETDFVAKNDDFQAFLETLGQKADQESAEAAEQYFEANKGDIINKLGENITFGGAFKLTAGDTVGGFTHFNNKIAALVALEGGSPEVATDISMHITAVNPMVLSPDEIDPQLVAKEKDIWTAELEKSGKPANIIENIMKGKEAKFRGENALLSQPFVKDTDKTIEQYAKEKGAKVVGFLRVSV